MPPKAVKKDRSPKECQEQGKKLVTMIDDARQGRRKFIKSVATNIGDYNRFMLPQDSDVEFSDQPIVCINKNHKDHARNPGAARGKEICQEKKVFKRLTAFEKQALPGLRPSKYINAVSEDCSTLLAIDNAREHEDAMHWANVVTAQVARYANHTKPSAQKMEDAAALAFKNIRRIVMLNIVNDEWMVARKDVAVDWCKDNTRVTHKDQYWNQDIWLELERSTKHFNTMLGTALGVGVAYLLAENIGDFGSSTKIKSIWINGARDVMEVILIR